MADPVLQELDASGDGEAGTIRLEQANNNTTAMPVNTSDHVPVVEHRAPSSS
jgi:hypothetical protein